MILSAVALSLAWISPSADTPVLLNRVFSKGEKLQYSVVSNLHTESRNYGELTFMPQDEDITYKFTTEVTEMKPDGIAVVHYSRPTMNESVNVSDYQKVDKVNLDLNLTLSPINEIIEVKDLNEAKKKKKGSGGAALLRSFSARGAQNPLAAMIGQFLGEVYRLSLGIGSLDSGVDLSPRLPFNQVKVGDTWKKTVGYQPQKLKSKEGKTAVQRLDYTYTYKGLITVNGKQFYRVNAALDLSTDLAEFIHQIYGATSEQTGLKSVPLTLKQSIDYDLDPKTKRTVKAAATADGGIKINATVVPDEPVQEMKLSGTTTMRLVGAK